MSPDLNVLALVKGNERFIFVFDDDSREELIDEFRNQAANPRLTFNWFDASVLTEKARAQELAEEPVEPAYNRISLTDI